MLKKRKRSHLRRKRIPTSILLRSKLKVCPFKEAGINRIDYKDVEMLKNYVTEGGKNIPSRISGVCAANQRKLKKVLPNQVENLFMNMFGDAAVWLTKFQEMILVFITPGTSLVQEKQ